MESTALERKKYPIGKFESPDAIHDDLFSSWVSSMETLPSRLEKVIRSITLTSWKQNIVLVAGR